MSQPVLLIITLALFCIAELGIPGGLTPRRLKQRLLAKRVAEHLDVISINDSELVVGGPEPIDKVHRNAIVHRGVWIFALDSHLRLLLSWRAPSMKTCPMTWAPIGEHAIANESFEDAARRGLSEEARFIARPRIYKVGQPFIYHYIYPNDTGVQRTDVQWTQAFVILPRGDALDFRTLNDKQEALLATHVQRENLRYQGMSLPDVVRHAMNKPKYFCNQVLVTWMLRVIPLIIRTLKSNEKRLFRGYLADEWATLVQSKSPVCCHSDEHEKEMQNVNISACGVPCESHNAHPSDIDSFT